MLREERTRTENEMLRNHTVQIEQLEAEARLKNDMQERVLKETMRLEKEKHERQWERKQKGQERLKEKARLKYAEIVKEQGIKQEKEN